MSVYYFTCNLVQDSYGRWCPSFTLAAGVTYSALFVVSAPAKAKGNGTPKTTTCLVAVKTDDPATIASQPGVTQLFPTAEQLDQIGQVTLENIGFNGADFLAWANS